MMNAPLPEIGGIARTSLVTLFCRALETQRPDGMIRDEKALQLVRALDVDFSRLKPAAEDQITTVMRAVRFDRYAENFLHACPDGTVVEIGCGLDTRFSRVDNGRVHWFDVDLPEVIEIRRRFFSESTRYRFFAGSILDGEWIPAVRQQPGPCLFLAEGVLPYLEARDVEGLVGLLSREFPGSELVFDALSPLMIIVHNPQLAAMDVSARLRWGLSDPRKLVRWGCGVELLDAWHYFEDRNPRLGWRNLARFIPILARSAGVYRYRLGSPS